MANVFEIKVKINEESDLYEPLNPEKELSQDTISYLERQIADRNMGETDYEEYGKRSRISV